MAPQGQLTLALTFVWVVGAITAIDIVADPDCLARRDVRPLLWGTSRAT